MALAWCACIGRLGVGCCRSQTRYCAVSTGSGLRVSGAKMGESLEHPKLEQQGKREATQVGRRNRGLHRAVCVYNCTIMKVWEQPTTRRQRQMISRASKMAKLSRVQDVRRTARIRASWVLEKEARGLARKLLLLCCGPVGLVSIEQTQTVSCSLSVRNDASSTLPCCGLCTHLRAVQIASLGGTNRNLAGGERLVPPSPKW